MNTDTKDGGARYPSVEECENRLHREGDIATTDAYIRAAIDEYRERGGQVGVQVVRLYRTIGFRKWVLHEADHHYSWAEIVANPERYETRELIARQPTGKDSLTVAKPAPEAAGRVVAWRMVSERPGWSGSWHDGEPDQSRVSAADDPNIGTKIELAYSHPATVPAEVMAAAEWLPTWTAKGSQQGAYATLIRDWFRSIQGAGHGQG